MSVTNAVYASVTLLQQGVIGVIGDISNSWTSLSALMTSTLEIPQCSFTTNAIAFSDKTQYKYFFRTIPTQVLVADVMLSFALKQGWNKLGILYTDDPLGQQFYQRALLQAADMDLHILQFQSIETSNNPDNIMNALKNISNSGARIIMIAATVKPQVQIMIQARNMGLVNRDYVWLMLGDTSEQLEAAVIHYNKNHTDNTINYDLDYQGLFMFDYWLSLDGYDPFENFMNKWLTLDPNALAYSCMMIMAEGFGKIVNNSKNQTEELQRLALGELGDEMLPTAFNIGYVGPQGPMLYDSNGDLTTGYVFIISTFIYLYYICIYIYIFLTSTLTLLPPSPFFFDIYQ
ncbi:periplasmic binding protein-like I [Cokeromyces recurvatus]|uniref:periplasmic binding protein-like I n=1 Tax=Cokeromyces recurvatus TaxID=90255 RepID=UPI00221E8ECC|nr:periplasmic binding protein-like I [Cokeromyces recurvatus]KAI7907471.1 periplasmic binding protein-like I [Cokeromyces recurvatus]